MKRVQELPTSFLKARLRHISKELETSLTACLPLLVSNYYQLSH